MNQPGASVPLVRMTSIGKSFGAVRALHDVSVDIPAGQITVLLGENGAGKSTLMQILFGLYVPDGGSIEIDGRPEMLGNSADAVRAGIGMVHQEFMLVPTLSVVENVILGLPSGGMLPDLKQARSKIAEISRAHGLQIDPDARVSDLSVGARQRVEIIKLLYRDARVLIFDEPTAVLSPQEVAGLMALLGSLRAQGKAIVLITHKLAEIMQVADWIVVMRKGEVVATRDAAGLDAASLSHMMVGREVGLPTRASIAPCGETRLSAQGIVLQAHGPAISLSISRGEIVGIAGVDGNGQQELADMLAGLVPCGHGEIILDGKVMTHASVATRRDAGIAYVPADRAHVGAIGSARLWENIALGQRRHGVLVDRADLLARTHRIIEDCAVRPASAEAFAGDLSGGNQQKLIIGREVAGPPRVLIAAYPTRGLDLGAVEIIWRILLDLRERGAAILLISADLDEIMALADRHAVLYRGALNEVAADDGQIRARIAFLMAGARHNAVA